MVNLDKISELLKKSVENPSFQNDEGKFSAKKWKKEVQEYTEPFLRFITEKLNEALKKEKDVWQENKFKTLKKLEGKQIKITSLQDAKCKLPEPFAIEARDNDRRSVEGFIMIGPSRSNAGEDYVSSVCWGLRWWGTKQKAQTLHEIFESLNVDVKLTNSVFSDSSFGTSAWLFNFLNEKELVKTGIESIAAKVTEDFLKLSFLLSENIKLFQSPEGGRKEKDFEETIRLIMPTKKQVKGAIQKLDKGQAKITDIFQHMESFGKEKGYRFVEGWKEEVKNILEAMSRNNR